MYSLAENVSGFSTSTLRYYDYWENEYGSSYSSTSTTLSSSLTSVTTQTTSGAWAFCFRDLRYRAYAKLVTNISQTSSSTSALESVTVSNPGGTEPATGPLPTPSYAPSYTGSDNSSKEVKAVLHYAGQLHEYVISSVSHPFIRYSGGVIFTPTGDIDGGDYPHEVHFAANPKNRMMAVAMFSMSGISSPINYTVTRYFGRLFMAGKIDQDLQQGNLMQMNFSYMRKEGMWT